MRSLRFLRPRLAVAAGTAAALLACGAAHAEQPRVLKLTVSSTGYSHFQAEHAQNVGIHVMPANTPAGLAARRLGQFGMTQDHSQGGAFGGGDWGEGESGTRYPGTLSYHSGPVVRFAKEYLIYVNMQSNGYCDSIATCWGDPHGFLSDLGQSSFIHIVDQYVDAQGGDRYRPSDKVIEVSYPSTPGVPYTDQDVQTIVYAVAHKLAVHNGYHAIYDVFLPPGQDECAGPYQCYSPDNPGTFVFCAYHGTAEFSDLGTVLYTVEPFQDVSGCSVRPNTPNGQLIDSTNNVLSHETIETITDPNVYGPWPTGWWNELSNAMFGDEIGDECSFLAITPPPPAVPNSSTTVFFDPSNVDLNGHAYAIQPEYSNAQHGCATSPPGGGDGWGNG